MAALQDDDKFTSNNKNRQARAKAIQRLIRQLPNDPKRQKEVIRHLALSQGIIPKTTAAT